MKILAFCLILVLVVIKIKIVKSFGKPIDKKRNPWQNKSSKETRGFPTMTLSNHFMVERMERMVYIGMNIGYGEIVFTYLDKRDNRRYCLTTTGLLEVLAPDEDVLITASPVM